MGPVAVIMLVVVIGVTVFRLCFVEGNALLTDPELRWETLKMLGNPFGFYLVCCMWGVVAGLLVCPLTYLVKRATKKRAARSQAEAVDHG